MNNISKEQLKHYKNIIQEFGDSSLDLSYGELDLLNATKRYFEVNDIKYSGLDVFESFDESMEKVKKAFMNYCNIKDDSIQEIYLKYPMMEKYYTDFFEKYERSMISNSKAVSMLYFWASHNPGLYAHPISLNPKPSVGTNKDWMSFTDSIYHLANGSLKEYEKERKRILPFYEADETNAKIFKNYDLSVLLVGKVIEEAEKCDNYMDKSRYLFSEFQNALDFMNISDMDTELPESPNKGDFYLWFELVNSANELCETGSTTNFEKNKQNVLKLYNKSKR